MAKRMSAKAHLKWVQLELDFTSGVGKVDLEVQLVDDENPSVLRLAHDYTDNRKSRQRQNSLLCGQDTATLSGDNSKQHKRRRRNNDV